MIPGGGGCGLVGGGAGGERLKVVLSIWVILRVLRGKGIEGF